MSQISTGTVFVQNGNATVEGNDTQFVTDGVSVGDLFIPEESLVSYEVASITNEVELQLTAPYRGTTIEGADYVIHTSFTPNKSYPFPETGDFETATIVKRAIKEIDSDIEAFNWRGEWQSGQQYAERDYVFTVDNDTVTIWISTTPHTSDADNAPGTGGTWQSIFSNDDINTLISQPITWKGDWLENTEYLEGDVVRQNLDLWIAPGNFVSGETFDPNDWDVFIDVKQVRDFRDAAEDARDKAEDAQSAAEVAQSSAEDAEATAQSHKLGAESARDTAQDHRDDAKQHRDDAQTAQSLSEDARDASQTARDKSQLWAEEDEDVEVEAGAFSSYHHRAKAESAQSSAESAESAALQHRDDAQSARDTAQTHRDDAQDARDAAQSAESGAQTAESGAQSAESDAEDHRDTADSHRVTAQRYANEDEDVTVIDAETGQDTESYSAYHWSRKAKVEATGGMIYRGGWDASTGTFPDDNPEPGDLYVVTEKGEVDGMTYYVGEMIIGDQDGGWDYVPDKGSVTSVAGKVGEVTLNKSDVGLGNVLNEKQATEVDFDAHTGDTGNPHNVTASDVGLGNVRNVEQYSQSESDDRFVPISISEISNDPLSGLGDGFKVRHHWSSSRPDDAPGSEGRGVAVHVGGNSGHFQLHSSNDGNIPELHARTRDSSSSDPYGNWVELLHDGNSDKFNSSGTYSGLRARATTKEDVGLEHVTNDAQLKQSSNLDDLDDTPAARSNLGLGSAATEDVGTSDHQIAKNEDHSLDDTGVYTSGDVTVSQSSPSGTPVDGEMWLVYE